MVQIKVKINKHYGTTVDDVPEGRVKEALAYWRKRYPKKKVYRNE